MQAYRFRFNDLFGELPPASILDFLLLSFSRLGRNLSLLQILAQILEELLLFFLSH